MSRIDSWDQASAKTSCWNYPQHHWELCRIHGRNSRLGSQKQKPWWFWLLLRDVRKGALGTRWRGCKDRAWLWGHRAKHHATKTDGERGAPVCGGLLPFWYSSCLCTLHTGPLQELLFPKHFNLEVKCEYSKLQSRLRVLHSFSLFSHLETSRFLIHW